MKQRNEFYWDKNRKQWRKRFVGPDGRQHDAWGKTKTACRDRKAEMELEIIAAMQKPDGSSIYFYEYARQWYRLNTTGVKAKTREGYASYINKHICPIIGGKLLSDLRKNDILEVMAACSHLSKVTQGKILSMTRRILEDAVENELIQKNPASKKIKPGGAPTAEKEPINRKQQEALVTAVEGTKAEAFVKLCLYAGLRREEALGLKWRNVDLKANPPFIRVRSAVNWNPSNGAPELVDLLKSDAARRDIPIPPQLADCLRAMKRTGETVITNSKGGVMSKQSFRRLWECVTVRTADEDHPLGSKTKNHRIVRTLDFHCSPHLLRHTYVSELLLHGANIKTVQYLAGHANAQITLNIYAHLMEHRPQDTFGAVAAAYAPQASGSVSGSEVRTDS